MGPAELVAAAVAVLTDPSSQLLDFVDELLPGHLVKVGVHEFRCWIDMVPSVIARGAFLNAALFRLGVLAGLLFAASALAVALWAVR